MTLPQILRAPSLLELIGVRTMGWYNDVSIERIENFETLREALLNIKMAVTSGVRYPFRRSWRWHFVALVDGILDRYFKHPPGFPFPNPVKNILILRLDQIGDIVCSLPVLPILRKQYPDAKITALVGEEARAVLEGNPYVDRIIVFRSNWSSRSRRLSWIELCRVILDLRKEHFDLGFDLRGDLRNILLMTFAGVRYRVGYGIAGGSALLHQEPDYDKSRHQVELNLRLVTDEEIDKNASKPEIYLTLLEKQSARECLRGFGVHESDRVIAVHPEAGCPSKEWEAENFQKLINGLLADCRLKILILGVSKAEKIATYFSLSTQVVNLVRRLSLREMIGILSQCDLLIGNDSGPSHIAQALGIPVVVIASGTNEYEQWGVRTEPSRILKHEVPCAPCHLRRCKVEGHPCMSQISPAHVARDVEEMVNVGRGGVTPPLHGT